MERFLSAVSAALGMDVSSLSINLSKNDISEWDSLGHLKLLLGLEEEFGIQFSMEEAGTLSSLQDIFNLIKTRTNHE